MNLTARILSHCYFVHFVRQFVNYPNCSIIQNNLKHENDNCMLNVLMPRLNLKFIKHLFHFLLTTFHFYIMQFNLLFIRTDPYRRMTGLTLYSKCADFSDIKIQKGLKIINSENMYYFSKYNNIIIAK